MRPIISRRRLRELALGLTLLVAFACGGATDKNQAAAENTGASSVVTADEAPTVAQNSDPAIVQPSPAAEPSEYEEQEPREFQEDSFRGGSRFVALDFPDILSPEDAAYFSDDELVLGLELNGEARAYPLRMTRYHHVVNDTLGDRQVVITY